MVDSTLPQADPIQITFPTLQDALTHQSEKGGWVFCADHYAHGYWFCGSYFTAASVMLHPITSGKSGELL